MIIASNGKIQSTLNIEVTRLCHTIPHRRQQYILAASKPDSTLIADVSDAQKLDKIFFASTGLKNYLRNDIIQEIWANAHGTRESL